MPETHTDAAAERPRRTIEGDPVDVLHRTRHVMVEEGFTFPAGYTYLSPVQPRATYYGPQPDTSASKGAGWAIALAISALVAGIIIAALGTWLLVVRPITAERDTAENVAAQLLANQQAQAAAPQPAPAPQAQAPVAPPQVAPAPAPQVWPPATQAAPPAVSQQPITRPGPKVVGVKETTKWTPPGYHWEHTPAGHAACKPVEPGSKVYFCPDRLVKD